MGYIENIYTNIFDALYSLLESFKSRADKADEPAAYIWVEEGCTTEEADGYSKEVDAFFSYMEGLEREAEGHVGNAEIVPLFYLFRVLQLDSFEKFCFILSLACSSDALFRRMINYIYDDYGREYPDVELCSRIVCPKRVGGMELCAEFVGEADSINFLYGETGYIESGNILRTPLKISERILRFIYDISSEDAVLKGIAEFIYPTQELEEMVINREYAERLGSLCDKYNDKYYVCIHGEAGVGKRTVVRKFCKEKRLTLLEIDVPKLVNMSGNRPPASIVNSIYRESVLRGNTIVSFMDCDSIPECGDTVNKLIWELEKRFNFFIVTSAEEISNSSRVFKAVDIHIAGPGYSEMRALWEHYITAEGLAEGQEVVSLAERLSEQYMMNAGEIRSAAEYAVTAILTGRNDRSVYERIVEGCRRQFSHSINNDAAKIDAVYSMDNLILPDKQKQRLWDAINQVRYKNLVYNEWGFAEKMAYGRGVSMIFYGPPGTGKTMGAQVIANELGLELYRVDLSSVMSKYVGEAEKKLNNIFEQGRKSQSILFFDEADSLFGKRSEVKDSQDKYANASTAFLLQKMEDYDGIIILATNLLQNFDAAFMRRFKFVIEFPFPDVEQRTNIWKSVFPERAPLSDNIDFEYLGSQFKLSGSQIKSTALAAMFLAAAQNVEVALEHILISIKR